MATAAEIAWMIVNYVKRQLYPIIKGLDDVAVPPYPDMSKMNAIRAAAEISSSLRNVGDKGD